MSTTHTPGTWYIGMRPGPIIYGPQGEQVADMRDTMLGCSEHAANAALIAAAPDLLNACHAALSQLTEGREEYLQADIDQIKAAIAKATGVDPGEVTP